MRARAGCHPGKPEHARGLCNACYGSWKYHNFPEIAKRRKEYARQRRLANPEKHAAYNKAWYQTHREHSRKKQRDWYAAHPAGYRPSRMRKTYGLDIADYEAMLKQQNSACAVCGRAHEDTNGKRLAIDHDHATGAIRGLLCNRCNGGLGLFDDDPVTLEAALKYLLERRLRVA